MGERERPDVDPRDEYTRLIFESLPFGEDGSELPPTETEARMASIIDTMSRIIMDQADEKIPQLKTNPFALFTVEHRDEHGHLTGTSRMALLTASYNKLPDRKLYLVLTPKGFFDIDLSITDPKAQSTNRAFEHLLAAARKRRLNPDEQKFFNRTFARIWSEAPPHENEPITEDITGVDKPVAVRKIMARAHIEGAFNKVMYPRGRNKQKAA